MPHSVKSMAVWFGLSGTNRSTQGLLAEARLDGLQLWRASRAVGGRVVGGHRVGETLSLCRHGWQEAGVEIGLCRCRIPEVRDFDDVAVERVLFPAHDCGCCGPARRIGGGLAEHSVLDAVLLDAGD